jgi:hypothetical protein
MKSIVFAAIILASAIRVVAQAAPIYDARLATQLGADERGMKMYVLCILKTGPNDAKIT